MDEAITHQGREEYTKLVNNMKKDIFGNNKCRDQDLDIVEKIPRFLFLHSYMINGKN
jgi:hypothetical protein